MGVINTTPDSFSDGGVLYGRAGLDIDRARYLAEDMLAQGAAIVDIGGESTRPGASAVSLAEEMDRVLPLLEHICADLDIVVSVDTSSPALMREAARLGAGMINDVRALGREGAVQAAAESGLPVCLMHMQGNPADMQTAPHYAEDVLAEVAAFLQHRAQRCIDGGIPGERLLLDPGFGFGKSVDHNLRLLQGLPQLAQLGYPLLAGLSRKSMIGKLIGRNVAERMPASVALAVLAVERGAKIVRVHDVAATVDAVAMCVALGRAGEA
jgi:dihydropteroate synthase